MLNLYDCFRSASSGGHRPARRFLALLPLLLWLAGGARAQAWCGTPALTDSARAAYRLLVDHPAQRATSLAYVPLSVNLVRATDGTGGADPADLYRALADANQRFAPAGVQFYICGAIRYCDNSTFLNFNIRQEASLCSSRDVPGTFNLYLVDQITAGNQSVCGYAYVPLSSSPLRRLVVGCLNSRTLTHELAHTFGLLHTFEGNTGPVAQRELVARTNCTTAGDLLCDTPADPYGLPGGTAGGCQYTGTALDPQGVPYAPALDNLMGYWTCHGGLRFSPEQVQRMATIRQSAHAGVRCLGTDPAAPTGLTAALQPSGGVALAWQDRAGDELGYFIERADHPAADYVTVGWVPADQTSWLDPAPATLAAVRYRVKPINAQAAFSNEALVTAGLSYCVPHYSAPNCGAGKPVYIQSVRLKQGSTNVLVNATSGCGNFRLFDYSAQTTLRPGLTYSLRVDLARLTATTAHPQYVGIWLDLNANGSFLDVGEQLALGTQTGPVQNFSFTLPASGVVGGITRLRIRSQEGQDGPVTDPCESAGGGETEDYAVTLTPTCPLAAPTLTTNAPVCVGSALQLRATGVPPGAACQWRGPNGFSANRTIVTIPNASAAAAGQYQLTILQNGCSAAAAVAAMVDVPPALRVAPAGVVTICQGDSLLLLASGADTYGWSTGQATAAIRVWQPGTYRVTGGSFAGSCPSQTDSVVVRVIPRVSGAFHYPSNTLCHTDSLRVLPTVTGTPGGRFYQPAGWTGLAIDSLTGRIDVGASYPGAYSVRYVVDNGCSHDVQQQQIQILSPANFHYYRATGFWSGNSTPVSLVCTSAGDTLLPYPDFFSQLGRLRATPAGLALDSVTGRIVLAASQPGVYDITNTLGDTAACPGVVGHTQLVVLAPPAIHLTADTTVICPGDQIRLRAYTTGAVVLPPGVPPQVSTLWFGISQVASTFATFSGDSAEVWVRDPGTYFVIYQYGGCQVVDTLTIRYPPNTSGGFNYDNMWACVADTGVRAPTMWWGATKGTFTARPAGLALDSVTGQVRISVSQPGVYMVTNALPPGLCHPGVNQLDSTVIEIADRSPRPTLVSYPQPGGVLLIAEPPPGTAYDYCSWFRNGQRLWTAYEPHITLALPADTGTYTAIGTISTGCNSVLSEPLTVRVMGTAAAGSSAHLPDVWPNPTRGGFMVGGGTAFTQVQVLDATGRQVCAQAGPPRTEQRLDVALPPGIYSVRLTTAQATITRRLVVLGTE